MGPLSEFSVCLAQCFILGLVQEEGSKGRNEPEEDVKWVLGERVKAKQNVVPE